ncbi:DNA repair protein RadA/Sms [Seinonella peptonophila]|uniref:DNA repair protein RadA n=1 Tax=Seinonella peptonophila TaxID=112248 RepID=A0A1M4YTN5_9BACL|nr:DNA repair protein RadA [Seinonella peptonophila]SHF09130.1 DNA repair protein RadA/Sms [Seinonella peptonophila]
MVKTKTKFVCGECGYETPKWMGRCPGCNTWNSLVEEKEITGGRPHMQPMNTKKKEQAIPITEVKGMDRPRFDTGIREYNRVLGGGLVPGSLILVGGDPGIGKSTLLLQSSYCLAAKGESVLYVTGEESTEQIRLRAERLQALHQGLEVAAETDLTAVEELLREHPPKVLVIDSIQTMFHPEITSAPGSVSQVRECTGQLMRFAKQQGIAVIIVGHVTKSGAIAGPRMLEHMVDTVLYFEGERHHTFRILRAVKNRFGSTNEIGVFEMKEQGLVEVGNPSEIFLEGRPNGVPGTAVTASIEGTRPVLVELQALVAPTNFPSPKRMATGVDHNRVTMIMAVLEKRLGFFLQSQDAYLNVVGGVRLDEPAIDLAIAIALASSFRDAPVQEGDLFIGEIGLTGEVRAVSRIEQRLSEAKNMGFRRVFFPDKNHRGLTIPDGLECVGVSSLQEALAVALRG